MIEYYIIILYYVLLIVRIIINLVHHYSFSFSSFWTLFRSSSLDSIHLCYRRLELESSTKIEVMR